MVFINEIEPEAIDIDSGYSDGYSDVSGESSPSPQSPRSPPLSPVSDGVRFVYYPVVPYYIIPVYRSDIPLAISPAFDQYSEEENVDFSIQTPSFASSSPSIGRLIKWTLPPPTVPNYPMPDWDPMPYGMEQFWQSAFAWFFRPLWVNSDHLWTLSPISSPPVCQYKHGWTSMKGRVVFWYRMRRHENVIISEAHFKLYGQQCNRCYKNRQGFLTPLWYHEEIENAVRFLASEVAKTYYGGEKLPVPRRLRQGNPSKLTHHDPTRCQACVEVTLNDSIVNVLSLKLVS
ncbi:hypothetical protein DAPPUDRAFT_252145 [Daphnia pulex]|uniref:3CxxC-type domain-containing protein n=1 Tax=Daphnia pulex TaxID=6669 RepID=E9H227_DAPPU|nr:hypothetical protein DAPPUDRAFT_252145 [Daphnia pulex]|eukprot:EFX74090.1 hypothetical protein DAPPUDRAFT_252145 [Daphnia pulex]